MNKLHFADRSGETVRRKLFDANAEEINLKINGNVANQPK